MPRVSESKLQMIAVELGAPWPGWLDQPASGTRRVIAELEGETPAVFAARVLEAIGREHLSLASAVLLCNERADAAQTAARRALAQALLGGTADKKSVALTIAASIPGNERLQRALATLANELGRRASLRNANENETDPIAAVSRVAVA